jgi:SCF-associated factor 1
MDARGQVWTFLSWGRPFRLASALLDCGTPETTPRQVECGWAFSSVLTQSGDVFAFWPFAGAMGLAVREQNSSMDQQGDDKHAHVQTTGIIPCVTWDLHMDPTRLPAIPDLPDLESTANIDTRLIQIAGLDNCLVGLTNRGHVLKYEHLQDETSVSQGRWEYVRFSSSFHSRVADPLE